MSIAKVIELSAESETSFEDAVRRGIHTAAGTLHNIKSAWVKEQQAVVVGGDVVKYRVDLKLTFVLDDEQLLATV